MDSESKTSIRSVTVLRALLQFVWLKTTKSLEGILLSAGRITFIKIPLISKQISKDKLSYFLYLIKSNIRWSSLSKIRQYAASKLMDLPSEEGMTSWLEISRINFQIQLATFLGTSSILISTNSTREISQEQVEKILKCKSGRCFKW